MTPDYIIEERNGVYWPRLLAYRDRHSRRGYRTREEAEARCRVILEHYARIQGKQGQPDLRVVERERAKGAEVRL